jgi:hypothetical protein
MHPKDTAGFEFGGPATYRIVVQGAVSREWSGRFGGMEITTSSQEGGAPQTILLGRIRDQAALRGVLETLYAFHLPILEVKKVDTHSDQDPAE